MTKYTINSKIFMPLTKGQSFIKILYKGVFIMYALIVLFQMWMEGFSWYRCLTLVMAYLIVKSLFARFTAGYQDTLAELTISDKQIMIDYVNVTYKGKQVPVKVEIPIDAVSAVEYSKELGALRFVGSVYRNIPDFKAEETLNDWVLYVSEGISEIINSVEEISLLKIKKVDEEAID